MSPQDISTTMRMAELIKATLQELEGKIDVEDGPTDVYQMTSQLTPCFAEPMGMPVFNTRGGGVWNTVCQFASYKPLWPEGYQSAIINVVLGHYRQCEDDPDRIVCRDRNVHGTSPLTSWHDAPSFGEEEDVPVKQRNRRIEAVLRRMVEVLTARHPDRYPPLRRGVRLHEAGVEVRCYVRDGRPFMTIAEHDDRPYLIDVEVPDGVLPRSEDEMKGIYERTMGFVGFVTDNEASAVNLLLYWAYPFESPRPRYVWVLYGFGLNGKNLLIDQFRRWFKSWCGDVDPNDLALKGYEGKDAAAGLRDISWNFDSETDLSDPKCQRPLKKLATGDVFRSRTIGHTSRTQQTFIGYLGATNEPVTRTISKAFKRRLITVRMKDGHTDKEFEPMIDWLEHRAGGIELFLSSAYAWTQRLTPDPDVAIGDVRDLDQADQWFVSEVTNHGFARTADNPYMGPNRRAGSKILEMLGLISTRRDGEWVLEVGDEAVFAPYRDSYLKLERRDRERKQRETTEQAARRAAMPVTDVDGLQPLDVDRVTWSETKRKGGETGLYVPAGAGDDGKAALDWQKRVNSYRAGDTGAANLTPPSGEAPWAYVPGSDEMVIDWDGDHEHEGFEHGLNCMERDLETTLGSETLPMPFLERSARDGFHGTYGIPHDLARYFKASADGKRICRKLVDTKVHEGGYVITAGSRTPLGAYRPVARPDDGKRPMITQPMLEWFMANGYLNLDQMPDNYIGPDGKGHKTPKAWPAPHEPASGTTPDQPRGRIHVNDTPKPKGTRHNGARDQSWGLAKACNERGLDQADFDQAMDGVRRAAGDHNKSDTERSIRSAAVKNGFRYHEPRPGATRV